MPSKPDLSIKLLVEHLANIKPEGSLTASDTALDHVIGHGDVSSILDSANMSAEGRERFMRNVVKLIENDLRVPIQHSLARLHWLMPAFQRREMGDPTLNVVTSKRSQNAFEQFAGMAVLQNNFDAQVLVLHMSNSLPTSAHDILAPINSTGLGIAIDHAFRASRDALLDSAAPLKHFKVLAEVAATRCDFEAVEDGDETLADLGKRIASIDVLIRKFGPSAQAKSFPDQGAPVRSGKRRKPPKPRRDPP